MTPLFPTSSPLFSQLPCHPRRSLLPSSHCPCHSPLPSSRARHSRLHQDRWIGLTWCLPAALNFGVQRTSFTDFGISNIFLQSLAPIICAQPVTLISKITNFCRRFSNFPLVHQKKSVTSVTILAAQVDTLTSSVQLLPTNSYI